MSRNRFSQTSQQRTRTSLRNWAWGAPLLLALMAILFTTLPGSVELQDILVTSTPDPNITVCGDAKGFSVEYVNSSLETLTGQTLTISLTPGLRYQAGSLDSIDGPSIQEFDLGDLNAPVFSLDSLPSGEAIQFRIEYQADPAAMAYVENGGIPRHSLLLEADQGSLETQSSAFNVLYAALNILTVNPVSQSLQSGDTASRSLQVINAGYGSLEAFYIVDTHGEGLDWLGASLGSLNGSGDTLFLTGTDFQGIGNGDQGFDRNEVITITQTLTASGCQNGTFQSMIKAAWGCEGTAEAQASSTNANVSISLQKPDLALSTTQNMSLCFDSATGDSQSLQIKNNGAGTAYKVKLDLFMSSGNDFDPTVFARIDPATLQYRINGASWQGITPLSSQNGSSGGDYSCLGTTLMGQALIELPNIPPAATLDMQWDLRRCCVNLCQNQNPAGWKAKVTYEDFCETLSESTSKTGESAVSAQMNLFSETEPDIHDGERKPFHYTVSSYTNDLDDEQGAFLFAFTIPAGLSWSGNASDFHWARNGTEFPATELQFSQGVLYAKVAAKTPVSIPKSEVTIWLTGDCNALGEGEHDLTLDLNIHYQPDTSCQQLCEMPLVCGLPVDIRLHCPGPCDAGLRALDYSLLRTNFGLPDNNHDGKPDAGGSLDMAAVKARRAMVGDTIMSSQTAFFHTDLSHSAWDYAYAESNVELGTHLTVVGANVAVYDQSANAWLEATVPYSFADQGTDRSWTFDMSPSSLASSNPAFQSLSFGQGDSLRLQVQYQVSGNIGGQVVEIDFDNKLYASEVVLPAAADQYSCGDYDGRFTLMGYFFQTDKRNSVTIRSCEKEIQQSFYLSIGDCCSNFAGGNIFPQEYRQWGHVNEIYTIIPEHYRYVSARIRQLRTKATNSTASQAINNLSISRQSGDTIWFNIDSLYTDMGGSLELSDDGFNGLIWVKIAPSCDVPENSWQEMPWGINFNKAAILGGGTTDWFTNDPDRIRFQPPSITLSSPAPRIDGLQRTVSWELWVENGTRSSMDNAWLHVKAPSGDMEVIAIVEQNTGDTLVLDGDIFRIGALGANASRKFDVVATYGACSVDFLEIYSGYECTAYPATFNEFVCSFTQMKLYAEPKEAGFQVILDGQAVGGNCSDEVELTARILGTKLAHVDSLVFSLETPGGQRISYTPGTATVQYPLTETAVPLSDPVQNGNTFTWVLSEVVGGLQEAGLPGVLSIPNNELQIKLQARLESAFEQGDYLSIKVQGYESCRRVLPNINLAYDPSVTLSKGNLHELSQFASETWGLAWGDFDGDGYEDVFVPEYAPDKASALYRNKGDGSFESVIAPPLTTDRGSSPGAVWGDYDNDGDLDLFVPNNVQAENRLYRNEGNATFTRITEGAIASYGGYCHSASWIDYDADGWLDLFVPDYMPTRFNQLYHNNGDGTFSPQPASELSQSARFTLSASWADINLDGLPDVVLVHDREQPNQVYLNAGGGKFTALSGPWDQDAGHSNGASWIDYDRDGDMDLFIANSSDEVDYFYENMGNGSFQKRTDLLFAQEAGHSHSGSWGDIDNDGDLDLLVVEDQERPNRLYINQGDDQFVRVESPISQDQNNSIAGSWNDYDQDGDLDIYVGNIRSGNRNDLYINNRGQCRNWLCVTLDGVRSNRDGVGARVQVLATIDGESVWQTHQMSTHHGGIHTQNGFRLHFGLGDASQLDSVVVHWPSGLIQRLGSQPLNDCLDIQEQNGQRVSGRVYYDANQNCEFDSAQDTGIPGMLLEVAPGGRYVTTDADGYYSFFLEAGAYTVSRQPQGSWSSVCAPDSALEIKSGTDVNNRDYALSSSCTGADLNLKFAATAMRRGFRNTVSLVYQNKGVAPAQHPRLRLVFPAGLYGLSAAPAWDSVYTYADSIAYIWRPAALGPQEAFSIQITDSVGTEKVIGEPLALRASIRHAGSDCAPEDNDYTETYEVTGALDPNDKLVQPEGAISAREMLTYRIRFQNVGNRPADRVTLFDTLTPELDITTLEQEVASHPYQFEILPGRVLKWDFPGIQLPDSISDEPNSHGFVQFSIRTIDELPIGQAVTNSAGIEFDRTDLIQTNTTRNMIQDVGQLAQSGDIGLLVYPNPALDYARFSLRSKTFQGMALEIRSLELLDLKGKRIWIREIGNSQEAHVQLGGLTSDMYLIRAYDRYGFSYVTKLIIR